MSQHLLSPAMAGLLARIQRAQARPFHSLSPREARLAYQVAAEVLDLPRAPLPRVQELELPGADGHRCRARLYAHAEAADGLAPVLLYFHGGGFVIGGLDTHDSLCRQLALRSGAAVLALDYRLAPEHPFPAGVDDAWAALRWLGGLSGPSLGPSLGPALGAGGGLEGSSTGRPDGTAGRQATGASHGQGYQDGSDIPDPRALGLDPQRIAVGGDSAGGTLAAVCALKARDAGLPLALQLLITPGTAAHGDWGSRRLFGQGFLLDHASIEWFFEHYLAGAPRHDWRFAPLEAADLEGVAPACVLLAECDPLVDEGLAYCDRLRAAGVPVALELVRGVTHDFIKMGRALKAAGAAQQFIAHSLQEHWPP